MDEVNIISGFTRGLISKIVESAVKKKVGYDVDIRLNEFNAKITEGKARVHLNVDAELDQNELKTLLKTVGL